MNKNYDPSAGKAYEVIPDVRVLNMIQNKIGSFEDKFNIDINVLSCEMATEFTRVQQKAVEFDRKMLFCKILKEVIKKHNPTWLFDVIPTGSSVSGLAISNSDLDVAIYIPQAARVVDRECDGKSVSPEEKMVMWREKQINILQIVRLILKNEEQIKHRVNWEKGIQLVQAQIPILKIETSDGIECDISVVMDCFLSSMHNSFFIRQLASCDRFALLCFIVKRWADSTGLKNPKEGGFNRYQLVEQNE
uniref:NTP_transf_2 domain-containing protein n=1 Tax=Caenorhabditis tropicalis TaxID=1561998 RepID=A0A1I7UKD2_9PELO